MTQTYVGMGVKRKAWFTVEAMACPWSGCSVSGPGCLAFCRGCSSETCSESKVQFPLPFGSEQLIPCWLQSVWGLEGGEKEAERERPAASKRHIHRRDEQGKGSRWGEERGRERVGGGRQSGRGRIERGKWKGRMEGEN